MAVAAVQASCEYVPAPGFRGLCRPVAAALLQDVLPPTCEGAPLDGWLLQKPCEAFGNTAYAQLWASVDANDEDTYPKVQGLKDLCERLPMCGLKEGPRGATLSCGVRATVNATVLKSFEERQLWSERIFGECPSGLVRERGSVAACAHACMHVALH